METLPLYIGIVLTLSMLFTIYIFWKASGKRHIVLLIISAWAIIQGIAAYTGLYLDTYSTPPRFVVAVAPTIVFLLLLLISKRGRNFLNNFNLTSLTILHASRLPVELVLFWLCSFKVVSPAMTFEDSNFDIISGVTAPIIWWLCRSGSNRWLLLGWNIACTVLLVNIVTIAILSAPTPFQQISFDQPNIAVLYFPFIWLPSVIVPLVLYSHVISIRALLLRHKAATIAVA